MEETPQDKIIVRLKAENAQLKKRLLAQEFLGTESVKDLEIRMASEDFSYFSQNCPSCFFRLGVANNKKNINHLVHTPYFDIDEKSLEIGVGLMSYLTILNLPTQKTI